MPPRSSAPPPTRWTPPPRRAATPRSPAPPCACREHAGRIDASTATAGRRHLGLRRPQSHAHAAPGGPPTTEDAAPAPDGIGEPAPAPELANPQLADTFSRDGWGSLTPAQQAAIDRDVTEALAADPAFDYGEYRRNIGSDKGRVRCSASYADAQIARQEREGAAAPETAVAPSAADIFKNDGWDDLEPAEQSALQRALDEALTENPNLVSRRSANPSSARVEKQRLLRQEMRPPRPPTSSRTTAGTTWSLLSRRPSPVRWLTRWQRTPIWVSRSSATTCSPEEGRRHPH